MDAAASQRSQRPSNRQLNSANDGQLTIQTNLRKAEAEDEDNTPDIKLQGETGSDFLQEPNLSPSTEADFVGSRSLDVNLNIMKI